MLRRTMIALMTAALASGSFAADARARGGGGARIHMGGGHSSRIRFGGGGRGFRGGPRFGAYGDWSVNCSPLGWQRNWPDVCF